MATTIDEVGLIYSARKIVQLLGVKDQSTTYIWRRLVRIPGININEHAKKIDVPGPNRRGRPVSDFLLKRGVAANFAMICNDQRSASNRTNVVSERRKAEIIEMIEKCKIESNRKQGRDIRTYYYDLRNIHNRAKIKRQFSTWIGDIKRRNDRETVYIGSGFCKKDENDYYNFLIGDIDMFIYYKKSKRGRPKMVNAFALRFIAEYEATRYGVKLMEHDGGPAHWMAVNVMKQSRQEVNEIAELTDEDINGKPEDDDDGY